VKLTGFDVPLAPRPIPVLLFVQLNDVAVPLSVADTASPTHAILSLTVVIVGVGFTVTLTVATLDTHKLAPVA